MQTEKIILYLYRNNTGSTILNEDFFQNFGCFAFLDCNVSEIGRPKGDNMIQESFYNGWLHKHGIKYQSVEAPSGCCLTLFGPCSFRHSDLTLLDLSELTEILDQCNETLILDYGIEFYVYGDSIYRYHPHDCIKARYCEEPLTEQEILINKIFGSVRVIVEWGFRETKLHWDLVSTMEKLRLFLSPLSKYYYIVATLLRNAYCCMYYNNSTQYFTPSSEERLEHNITASCLPPTVDEYFRGNIA